jgi:hypothetical protein
MYSLAIDQCRWIGRSLYRGAPARTASAAAHPRILQIRASGSAHACIQQAPAIHRRSKPREDAMNRSSKAQGGILGLAAFGLAVAVHMAFGYALSRTPTHGQLYVAAQRGHDRLPGLVAGLPAVKMACKRS